MSEAATVRHKRHPRIIHAPRELSLPTTKIKPYYAEGLNYLSKNNDEPINRSMLFMATPEKPLQPHTIKQTDIPTFNDLTDESKTTEASTNLISKFCSSKTNNIESSEQKLLSHSTSKKCFSHWTSKQKCLLKLAIATVIIIIVATAAIIPPVYLFVILKTNLQSSFTNITISDCSTTTCIGKETPYRTSMVTVLYTFDGHANDLTGYASGALFGSSLPTYTSACYVGNLGIQLSSTSQQYVQIPYINLAQQSFTLQVWVYPFPITTWPTDYGIFGQCDSNLVCFLLSLRNGRFTLSFDSMNTTNTTLSSTTVFGGNYWLHVTVVYDAVLYQQQIYVNGKLDAIAHGTGPYRGTSSGSVTTIGRVSSLAYGVTYFTGRIDHFTASVGVARSLCQIYNDATLVAYYPFDTNGTFNDYSVNLFNGIGISTSTVSRSYLGQAIYFPSNISYFQALSFPSTRGNSLAFSVSLWVNPKTIGSGGSLVHISTLQNGSGSPCYDLLAFTSTGAIVAQWMQNTGVVNATQGSIIPANTWTHIAVVYSQENGLRLFINGQLSAISLNVNNLNLQDYNYPAYVTLGMNSPWGSSSTVICQNGSIPILPGQFIGAIDQYRLYNRELEIQEICVLSNI